MNLIQVDVVGTETREAGLDRLENVQPREADLVGLVAHAPADLRGEDHVAPPVAERAAEHRFRLAGRVDVRSVDEVDPGVERAMHERVGSLLVEAADGFPDLSPAAERHRAQAELGDEDTRVRKLSIFHPTSLSQGLRGERPGQHRLEDS